MRAVNPLGPRQEGRAAGPIVAGALMRARVRRRAHFAHAAGAPGAAACAGTPESYKLGLAMYSSYLVLFMMLFYANYLAPDAKHEVDCGCSARKAEAKKKYVMVCGVKSTRCLLYTSPSPRDRG